MPKQKAKHHSGHIPPLKGKEFPHHLLFFDTETTIERIDTKTKYFPLRLGIVIYIVLNDKAEVVSREVIQFKNAHQFAQILNKKSDKDYTLHIFAHNIKFDIMVLNLPFLLNSYGWYHSFPIINDRMFIWRANNKKKKIVFIDTANYGVITVEKLGEEYGYPKLKVDFYNVSDTELFTYCERDVDILTHFILDYIHFIQHNNLGSFQFTLASQAFVAYRSRFYNRYLYCHDHYSILKIEREAYHGARVECFRIGKLPDNDYYMLDVNSMYLYIMQSKKVPLSLVDVRYKPNNKSFEQRMERWYNIADVMLNTQTNAYPLYDRHKLLFPIGNFRTILHQPELEIAQQNGDIQDVYAICSYKSGTVFEEYANFFYEDRLSNKAKGNTSWSNIDKLFGNALYGKFGQSGHERQEFMGETDLQISRAQGTELHTLRHYTEIHWFGTIIREYKDGEATYSAPNIAGSITAYARTLLYQFIQLAKQENVYYCDTDSLIVNIDGYHNLSDYINKDILGYLKIEKQGRNVVINNAKDYQFEDKVRLKGVPTRSIQSERNKWVYSQFEGFISWVNSGANREPTLNVRTKQRKSTYDKGYVYLPTGKVYPWIYIQQEDENETKD